MTPEPESEPVEEVPDPVEDVEPEADPVEEPNPAPETEG